MNDFSKVRVMRGGRIGPSRQQGMTLMEMIISVIVVALVIAAIAIGAKQVFTGNSVNDASRNIVNLSNSIKGYFKSSGSYAGLTNTVVIDAHLAPASMISGTNLKDTWGGAVTITPATLGTVTDDAMQIVENNVSTSACSNYVSSIANNFDQVTVGTTNVLTQASPTLNPAALATACNAGGGSSVNITFMKI